MNNISVGDMAAQIMAQESFSQKKSTTPSKVTFEEDTSFYSPNVTEQSPDISDVEVPTDFVTNLLEGKAPTTSPPTPAPTAPQVVTTTEPLSEAAPDLQALVQEVRDLISELKNTLVEMTAVGSLGVNMAGPGKKKKEVEEEDPMKKILKKIKYRRASK